MWSSLGDWEGDRLSSRTLCAPFFGGTDSSLSSGMDAEGRKEWIWPNPSLFPTQDGCFMFLHPALCSPRLTPMDYTNEQLCSDFYQMLANGNWSSKSHHHVSWHKHSFLGIRFPSLWIHGTERKETNSSRGLTGMKGNGHSHLHLLVPEHEPLALG